MRRGTVDGPRLRYDIRGRVPGPALSARQSALKLAHWTRPMPALSQIEYLLGVARRDSVFAVALRCPNHQEDVPTHAVPVSCCGLVVTTGAS